MQDDGATVAQSASGPAQHGHTPFGMGPLALDAARIDTLPLRPCSVMQAYESEEGMSRQGTCETRAMLSSPDAPT